MALIEELDEQLAELDKEYQTLQEQRSSLETSIRDIRSRMTDLVKNKELILLLRARDIDTSNVRIVEGRLEQVAPGSSVGGQ